MKNADGAASTQFAELWDELLDEVVGGAADPTVCLGLAAAAGTYGPVTIDSTGDTYVAGDLVWDCAPYA